MSYPLVMSESRYNSRKMLEKLIAFPTVSSNSNLDLISFVEDYLSVYGVSSKRIISDCGKKANLYATIGPMNPGGIVQLSTSILFPFIILCHATSCGRT